MGEAGQVGDHHAEAVVEGHGGADAVVLGVAQQPTREVAVVEDVAVREGGALRGAGRARGELDVDRIVGIERRLDRLQVGLGHALAVGQQVVPGVLEDERLAQQRALGAHLVDHRHVVGLAEAARQDEQAHPGRRQRVLQLARLVGRVDGHEDRADARGGVLDDEPLVAVGRPDADAIARAHPAGQQSAGGQRHLVPQLAIRGPVALLAHHQRLALAEALDGAAQALADGQLQEGSVARAGGVREREGGGFAFDEHVR